MWESHNLPPHSMLVASLPDHSWPTLPRISFSGLGQHWVRETGEFLVSLNFRKISYKNIMSLNNFCHWLSQNWKNLGEESNAFYALNRSLLVNIVGFTIHKDIPLVFYFIFKRSLSMRFLGRAFLGRAFLGLISSYTENDKQQL